MGCECWDCVVGIAGENVGFGFGIEVVLVLVLVQVVVMAEVENKVGYCVVGLGKVMGDTSWTSLVVGFGSDFELDYIAAVGNVVDFEVDCKWSVVDY